MENNKEVATTEIVEQDVKEEVKVEEVKTEKTYTRAEVENIKRAEREILLKEMEVKRTEAEKLAKMDAEEKARYELEKERSEKETYLRKLNAYELEREAFKIAGEKGVPTQFLKVINFETTKAENLKEIIEGFEVVYKQSVEQGISEKMREKTPKTVVETVSEDRKPRASI